MAFNNDESAFEADFSGSLSNASITQGTNEKELIRRDFEDSASSAKLPEVFFGSRASPAANGHTARSMLKKKRNSKSVTSQFRKSPQNSRSKKACTKIKQKASERTAYLTCTPAMVVLVTCALTPSSIIRPVLLRRYSRFDLCPCQKDFSIILNYAISCQGKTQSLDH